MYYYFYPVIPQVYQGDYDERSIHFEQTQAKAVAEVYKMQGYSNMLPSVSSNIGNQCAFVADTPVQYNKPNIQHWPSQDATIEHPGGFTHTSPNNSQHTHAY
ncbi:hypothetical protein J2T56_002004 [Natronobacillus azotifigens]|uniref:Uncharacterized protein n=1 Tax=Natronobacillus azotifigens TaxID=472978 RepID=A0A9J6RF34_9BACI|nr:hypothetical protein [Natronobacillus azotifigens]MCZ0703785.1 hypothetical protein [Natronobacillus azotifigens]